MDVVRKMEECGEESGETKVEVKIAKSGAL